MIREVFPYLCVRGPAVGMVSDEYPEAGIHPPTRWGGNACCDIPGGTSGCWETDSVGNTPGGQERSLALLNSPPL